ncbi:MAG: hypothetical protein F4X36_06145 [Gammaproteobacteria bacterium]|nr:hypothetical protein [Gammaproteobacteria bacterium]
MRLVRIQIASDLHLERRPDHRPGPDAFRADPARDVLILAGDIGQCLLARDFVLGELVLSPVIYVPGNHEYYGPPRREAVDDGWRALAAEHPGLHYLVGESATVEGLRFWGAPWYSNLWGLEDGWTPAEVYRGVNDFHAPFDGTGAWNLSSHIRCHEEQTALLEAQAGNVDVVVTHWPPTREAMPAMFEGSELNPYYFNDHEDLVHQVGAKLWVSGHTHESYDYRVGVTRCVGNPSGYVPRTQDSDLFRPTRIVEVRGGRGRARSESARCGGRVAEGPE